uniref:Phosphatidylinositol-specific phospholipase C X domain-containing protein n=1 Tax=Amazona collaria TaxID=241587 RepID=A0A8B9FPB3_9PSIT
MGGELGTIHGMEAQCCRSAAFDCTPQPAACCPDWMAQLPDALPLSRLSIPGTHDSLSLFGGRRLRCQSWGLEAQLAAGVRFLDVRCKLARGELHVYHLCTFQRASLRGVLRRTLRFLRAHPGEAVLMRIKEELPIFSRPGFATQLQRCLLEEGQGSVWCQEEVPTLGQVRGKIVVLEALAQELRSLPTPGPIGMDAAPSPMPLPKDVSAFKSRSGFSSCWAPGSLHVKLLGTRKPSIARGRRGGLAAVVGAGQPRELPPACSSPQRSWVESRHGAGAAESLGEQQVWVEGEGPALSPVRLVSPPKMPLCKTVLFLSRVDKNKKNPGKHSPCCLAIS